MLEPVVIRPLFGRVVAVVIVGAVAVGLGTLAVSRPVDALRIAWIPVFVAALSWATLWLPSVRISDDEVLVRNVFQTITVPWPAIRRVDTKWALTLVTEGLDVIAWAAPAPGRHTTSRMHSADAANLPASAYLGDTVRPGDVPRSDSGDAATVIRFHLEALRDRPDAQPAAPDGPVTRRLHLRTIIVLAVLLLTAAVAAFL